MPKKVNTKKFLGRLGPPIIGGTIVGFMYNIENVDLILGYCFFIGLLIGFVCIYFGDFD